MKVLITGAAGFIGSQLAHRFWMNGEELVLADNFSYGRRENLVFPDHDFNEDIICMDIRDRNGIKQLFEKGGIDYVYNIAGIAPLPDCQLSPQEAADVNLTGFINILENARIYGAKKIIQASTNAIYENADSFPVKEDSFALPSLIYPNTKYAAERFAQSYCDAYGMSVTCLRFSNVYGPHTDCLRKQPPFMAYMIRELYYDRVPVFHSTGEQRRDYIYVDDLAELAVSVRNTGGFDAVNASSGRNYSVNELYEMAQKIMGKDIRAVYAQDAHYWEQYPGLYQGKFPVKQSILNHEINKYTLCDNSYAKEKYGWSPRVTMEEGMRIMIKEETGFLQMMDRGGRL